MGDVCELAWILNLLEDLTFFSYSELFLLSLQRQIITF